jgi:hypothetical protein
MRNSVVAVLIAGAGFGLIKGCSANRTATEPFSPGASTPAMPSSPDPSVSEMPHGSPIASTDRPAPVRAAAATAAAGTEEPLSSLHKDVLELAKQPLTQGTSDGKSRKWRVKRGKITIELRSDTDKGSTTWNRLKIDLDRDKEWDEAWDFVSGKPVKRRTSPADDGVYTVTYDLRGERWVPRKK